MDFPSDIISLIEKMTFDSPSAKDTINLSLVSKSKFKSYIKDIDVVEKINNIYNVLKRERKISNNDVEFVKERINFIMTNEIDIYTEDEDITLEDYRKFLVDLSYNYTYNKLYILHCMIYIGENISENEMNDTDFLLFEEESDMYQSYLHEVYEKLTRYNYACVYPDVTSLLETISYMENLSLSCKLCLGI